MIVVNPQSGASSSAGVQDAAIAAVVIHLVALSMKADPRQISAPNRLSAQAAMARQLTMYLLNVALSWSLARIGALFGRDRSAVGYACRRVESLRDNAAFDQRVNQLETCIRTTACELSELGQ